MWLASLVLGHPEYPWWQATAGIVFMYFWIHTIHRLLHLVPTTGIMGLINTHMKYHHQPADAKPLPRWIELVFETATDMGMNLLLLVIQWLSGVVIVPSAIIVFFTLTYMSVHILNYSIIGSETHRRHHTGLDVNYGPDTIDHIMGTNYDSTWEDMTPIIFNSAVVFVIVNYIKQRLYTA